jgi:Protein of unknown function (DUF1460)
MKRKHLLSIIFVWATIQLVNAQTCQFFIEQHLTQGASEAIKHQTVGDRWVEAATWMLGQPYVAGRLDRDTIENLVTDVYSLDCVTFVEYTAAFSQCLVVGKTDYEHFCVALTAIRYRDSLIAYENRLHYFTEWLQQAQNTGRIEPILNGKNAKPWHKAVNLVSANSAYREPHLTPSQYKILRKSEQEISLIDHYYVPSAQISGILPEIKSGDIIAFCSKKGGLDFEHVALAVVTDGVVKLLHASKQHGKSIKTGNDLSTYLLAHKQFLGVEIWRPLR